MRPAASFLSVALAGLALAARCRPPWTHGGRSFASPLPVHRDPPPWVHPTLVLLQVPWPAPTVWVICRATAGTAVCLTALAGAPVVALTLAAGAVATPRLLAPAVERRWRRRRDEQLAVALERLAGELRSGSALGPAFASLGLHTPDPLGSELRAAGAEVQQGAGLAAALDRWSGRPSSSADVRLVATALELGAAAGGGVARSVDRVAATLRERRELRAEVRALATQARASAAVLAVAPVAFAVLVAGVEPAAVRFLVSTPIGGACLVAGAALEIAGAAWMARIVRTVA